MDKNVTRTETYAYFCPICGAWSGDMVSKTEKQMPTKKEIQKEPHIATELLFCQCGRTWSWFDLEKRFMGFVKYRGGKRWG